jgi:hypothetical protein
MAEGAGGVAYKLSALLKGLFVERYCDMVSLSEDVPEAIGSGFVAE